MTPLPPHDPFVALWQTAPKPDTQQLLRDLQRQNRMHRRFNRALAAILCVVSLLLISEEASGRLATHGWLSAIWLLCLSAGALRNYRSRCHRSDVLERDTVSLLKFMVGQARRDLFLARWLYAGVPCGAAFGFLLMRFAAIRPAPSTPAPDPQLHLLRAGVGIAALIAMMVTGAVLARSRRIQVQELSEKLKLIGTDV